MQLRRWSIPKAGWIATLGALTLVACSNNAEDTTAVPAGGDTEAVDFADTVPVMGPERRIIAFGDSLFAGFGLRDAAGDSYPAKLEAALRAKGINTRIVNAGISGDTTAGGKQRIGFLLDQQKEKPDLFILELGANDVLRGLPVAEARANMVAMLDELKKREIPVLIYGLKAPANYGPEYAKEFDAIYTDLAKQYGASLIPFWLEDIYQDRSLFQSDRIHPTEEGIEALVASTIGDVQGALPKAE
jgi:acyl-CoA thioesterase-1